LGARSADFVVFYDWESARVVRRIDVTPRKIYWNDSSLMLAIATSEELYILQFHHELLEIILLREEEVDGAEEAFDILNDLTETVTSGVWISNVFYYTNSQQKICYTTNGRVFVLDTDRR
jgi:coatomer subunit beta'